MQSIRRVLETAWHASLASPTAAHRETGTPAEQHVFRLCAAVARNASCGALRPPAERLFHMDPQPLPPGRQAVADAAPVQPLEVMQG